MRPITCFITIIIYGKILTDRILASLKKWSIIISG